METKMFLLEQFVYAINSAFKTYAQFGGLDDTKGALDDVIDDYRSMFPNYTFDYTFDGLNICYKNKLIKSIPIDYSLDIPKANITKE